ncbi:MAG: DUF456 domain-containing protein [Phycisphaerae bacterium]|nr:DUF456 domain-containing protein [Phycisphaerae bacterium]
MITAWIILLLLVNLAWLATVPFALPGNWLMIITTALFAWWHRDAQIFSVQTLVAVTVLAVIGEVIEFLGGFGGAKGAGARWQGAFGAIFGAVIGGLVGTFVIPLPVLGTLLGACVGAGVGTFLLETAGGRTMRHAFRSGVGAGVGVFIGTTTKCAIGVVIYLTIAVAAFWP